MVPLVYAVLGGFRDNGQIGNSALGWPDPWVPTNYTEVLGSESFWRQVGNSVLIAAISTFVVVGLSALAAFAFARLQFPGRELVFTFFALGLLFPAAVAILPLYILVRGVGLLDTPLGVALPQAAFQLPADDPHPAAVLPGHPGRAGGRGPHRRLRSRRLLLADPAAARRGRRWSRWRCSPW